MKRIFLIISTLILIFTLVACVRGDVNGIVEFASSENPAEGKISVNTQTETESGEIEEEPTVESTDDDVAEGLTAETGDGEAGRNSPVKVMPKISASKQPLTEAGYIQAYIDKILEIESEYTGDTSLEYDLIYLDEDSTPELVVGVTWYYVSVYTYSSGLLYTIMDDWPYGAMGNSGYEYIPKKNIIRNYNSDLAGAIVWEYYGYVDENYEIQPYNDEMLSIWMFKDENNNYMIDEGEYDETTEVSYYYYGKREITPEEYESYQKQGNYELICGKSTASEIIKQLQQIH
jgi:hypothetical protein